ncbi:MAG: iron-sulfur cluster assembly scaffold protein [Sphingomonadales bacterium]|nr:iron-sulfur cluster assembly scaffold protein [Sphingomonadales bacterium]
MSELYNTKILRLAMAIPLTERLGDPDVTVTRTSRICGSRVTVDLKIEKGVITGYGQEVKACALGQAACSLVAGRIIGKTEADFAPVAEAMRAMLAGEGPPPTGAWSELEIFLPAVEHKSRHGSIMLPFEAVMQGFAEARSGADLETTA